MNRTKKIATLVLALTPEFTHALAGLAIMAQLTLTPLHQHQRRPENVVRNPWQPAALKDILTKKTATLALARRTEFMSAHVEPAIMARSSLTPLQPPEKAAKLVLALGNMTTQNRTRFRI